jgi:hypothetical protein
MHVILATWEAEISRIAVQSQPRQILYARPIYTQHEKGLVKWIRWFSACLASMNSNSSTTEKKKCVLLILQTNQTCLDDSIKFLKSMQGARH